MPNPFYTVGHAKLAVGEFVGLLAAAGADFVVDVRAFPRSRTNPQFNVDSFPPALAASGIGYEHLPALGGRRPRQPDVPPERNAFWSNASFHNYADYALSEDFARGLDRLRELGAAQRCAIMCAEAVWWRCHRRIIADYLLAADEAVLHIMGPGHIETARVTEGAQRDPSGHLVYPAPQQELGL